MPRGEHVLSPNDTDLVVQAQGGDVDAVGQLYDRYHERIFRYVWSRTSDRQLAEDLTGETFARMVSHLHRYRPQGVPFAAWLYRIARNLIVDHHRREAGRISVPLAHAEGRNEETDDMAAMVERNLSVERVRQALAGLDLTQREVIELRFLARMSLQEVAQVLGRSVAAVKSLQHRGLAALRLALQHE